MNEKSIEFDQLGYLLYDIRKYGMDILKKIVDSVPLKGITIKMWLDTNASGEILVSNNLSYFEYLQTKGISINFIYGYQHSVVSDRISLAQVKEDEAFMNAIVAEISTKFSSNLKRTIAAFDITKNLKEFKEEEKDMNKAVSRCLYCYLDNDYLVCAGYANFFKNLLTRLNIPAVSLCMNLINGRNHIRNYVYLKDDENGIEGIYSVDCRMDNFREYSHFLETTEERKKTPSKRQKYTKKSLKVYF